MSLDGPAAVKSKTKVHSAVRAQSLYESLVRASICFGWVFFGKKYQVADRSDSLKLTYDACSRENANTNGVVNAALWIHKPWAVMGCDGLRDPPGWVR